MVQSGTFRVGGQVAWQYDLGHRSGYFRTYDRLVSGPGAAPRRVHVYLPRGYEASSRRYPVVYMGDGQTAFFPGGPAHQSWDVAGALDGLAERGEPVAALVVAVCPVDRDREYTHARCGGGSCCGVAGYTAELADRLKPFLDRHYRTRPGLADPGFG